MSGAQTGGQKRPWEGYIPNDPRERLQYIQKKIDSAGKRPHGLPLWKYAEPEAIWEDDVVDGTMLDVRIVCRCGSRLASHNPAAQWATHARKCPVYLEVGATLSALLTCWGEGGGARAGPPPCLHARSVMPGVPPGVLPCFRTWQQSRHGQAASVHQTRPQTRRQTHVTAWCAPWPLVATSHALPADALVARPDTARMPPTIMHGARCWMFQACRPHPTPSPSRHRSFMDAP